MTLLPDVERSLTDAVARQLAAAEMHATPPAPRGRRRRSLRLGTIVLAVAVSLTAGAAAAGLISTRSVAPAAHHPLPIVGGNGSSALADYRGRPLVVTFYATWCPPCAPQARIIDRLGRQLTAGGRGAALLIDFKDDGTAAGDFVARSHLSVPVLGDPHDRVARAYAIVGIPTTFVVDADGRLASTFTGLTSAERLRAAVAAAARRDDGS